MVVTMEITMLMHTALICPKDTFPTEFGQWKWTIIYGYTVGFLIYSMVYKLLGNFEPNIFWSKSCRSLELKPLDGIQGFKEGLIWDLERSNQHKLGCL